MSNLGHSKLQLQKTEDDNIKRTSFVSQIYSALRSRYGHTEFRGKQEEAVRGVLTGRDILVLMPTGGGKSLCYGLPPLVKPGVAVVVSPLIALMQDQVQSMLEKGIKASYISSCLPNSERKYIIADITSSKPSIRLLFLTPELLASNGFQRTLQVMYNAGNLLMVAVDEAHCISSYGHDFRPAYRKLSTIRAALSDVPIMALTATATARVQDDICQQLKLRSPTRLISTFNRPNITYQVRYVDLMVDSNGETSLQCPLPDILKTVKSDRNCSSNFPCCIVYTRKRDDADHVAHELTAKGIACKSYHAGIPDDARSEIIKDWCAGRLNAVAATVAFGMGIDRADVRLVFHYNLPKSIEGLYQESGRAGRDGAPSKSILYYSNSDRQSLEYLLQTSKDRVRKRHHPQSASPPNQQQDFGAVVEYCLKGRCRRSMLLAHFGEQCASTNQAGCCDVCDNTAAVEMAVRSVKIAGLQRRQALLKQRVSLDVEGGKSCSKGIGGDVLIFEMERPSEGLDFERDVPSTALLYDGRISVSEEAFLAAEDDAPGDLQADEALERARQLGAQSEESILAIMEAAEAQHTEGMQRGDTKHGIKSRLLAKLESGHRLSAVSRPGSSNVSEILREHARTRLVSALLGNPCLADTLLDADLPTTAAPQGSSTADRANAVAYALESLCYKRMQSKSVYQSKMGNLVRQVRDAKYTNDVLQLSKIICSSDSLGVHAALTRHNCALGTHLAHSSSTSGQPCSSAADARQRGLTQHQDELTGPQLQAEMRAIQQMVGLASTDQCEEKATETAIQAAQALQRLATARISIEVLINTGAGKQIKALRKHAIPCIAAAASEVIKIWKARILAD